MVSDVIFDDPRLLLDWDSEGFPVWQDWPLMEQVVYEPLLARAASLSAYSVEWESDSSRITDLRAYLDGLWRCDKNGGWAIADVGKLLGHPLAPLCWATGSRAGYSLSWLMLFDSSALSSVLRTLSFLPLIVRGPLHCSGNWAIRDRVARKHVRSGGLAIVTSSMAFRLFYPSEHEADVRKATCFVESRWAAAVPRPGDVWHPKALLGDVGSTSDVSPPTTKADVCPADRGLFAYLSPDQLRVKLGECGLGQYAEALVRLGEPAVSLAATRNTPPLVGSSRIGGLPDFPRGVAWPRSSQGPLTFLIQINCRDIAPFDRDRQLPAEGLLSIFFDVMTRSCGIAEGDELGVAVLYFPSGTELGRAKAPEDLNSEEGILAGADAVLGPLVCVHDHSDEILAGTGMGIGSIEVYREMVDELGMDEELTAMPQHHLLGLPGTIQGDMHPSCASGGGDRKESDMDDWQLLLQIDSDDRLGICWGDMGRMCLWIREADLKHARFSAVRAMVQCY